MEVLVISKGPLKKTLTVKNAVFNPFNEILCQDLSKLSSYCALKVHKIIHFPSKFRQFRPPYFKILTQTLLLKKANDLSWEKFAELCGKWVNPVQDIFECGRRDLILTSIMKNQIWVLWRFKVGFCPFPVRFFFCENTKCQCHFETFKG